VLPPWRHRASSQSLSGKGRRVGRVQSKRALFQVYMFKCVWTCYRFMKHMNSAVEDSSSKLFLKVSLTGLPLSCCVA